MYHTWQDFDKQCLISVISPSIKSQKTQPLRNYSQTIEKLLSYLLPKLFQNRILPNPKISIPKLSKLSIAPELLEASKASTHFLPRWLSEKSKHLHLLTPFPGVLPKTLPNLHLSLPSFPKVQKSKPQNHLNSQTQKNPKPQIISKTKNPQKPSSEAYAPWWISS